MYEIACIGTRELPETERPFLNRIGQWLAQSDFIIASGNADGSDNAFAQGANQFYPKRVNLYLPWSGYNSEKIVKGNGVIVLDKLKHDYAFERMRRHHPASDRLKQGAQKLHARNALILKEAIACIAYHPTPGRGGTEMGVRLAEYYGIPVINIAFPVGKEKMLSKMKNEAKGNGYGL